MEASHGRPKLDSLKKGPSGATDTNTKRRRESDGEERDVKRFETAQPKV